MAGAARATRKAKLVGNLKGSSLMLIKIITLSFSSTYGGFDDAELSDFTKDHEIISVRDHFFIRHDVAHLTLVINYLPAHREIDTRQKSINEESWRKSLSESDIGLFNMLREWRATGAKKDRPCGNSHPAIAVIRA